MKNGLAIAATIALCLSAAVPAFANCKDGDDCCKDKASAKKECHKKSKASKSNKEASTDSKASDTKSGDAKEGDAKTE